MNIFVLLKQTFDTEEKVVIEDGHVVEDDAKFIINPYDEYAVEEAIQTRDQLGGKVTLVSVGPERTKEALRTALAMGADEAILISDARIPQDEAAVSHVLYTALKDQAVDMIVGGNFSVDHGAGQVAIRLAKLLQLPHVGSVTNLEVSEQKVIAERDAEGDKEVIEVQLPALFTAQQGLNEPRYPSLPGIMKAKKKPFRQLTLDDLQLSPASLPAKTKQHSLFLPPERKAGKILQGDIKEHAALLVNLLKNEDKAI